ncbi:hypothetical protein LA080_013690 [Diaporthe eres]|nr:hypothetical protein LA080_013690 [Diaporthe eres]
MANVTSEGLLRNQRKLFHNGLKALVQILDLRHSNQSSTLSSNLNTIQEVQQFMSPSTVDPLERYMYGHFDIRVNPRESVEDPLTIDAQFHTINVIAWCSCMWAQPVAVVSDLSSKGWDDYLDEVEKMSKKTYAIFPDAPFTNWTKEKTTPDRYRPQGDIGPRSMLHDHLTLLESLEEKLHSAQTIVEMNREVVNQITDYFDELTCSATLQSRMDLGPFGEDVSMFFRDIKMLYRRLGNQQERLQNLLWLLARRRAEVSYLKL